LGNYKQVRKVYTVCRTIFLSLGLISALLMGCFAGPLANFMGQPNAKASIAILAPASFLICLMSTYRGFFQGQSNMAPTSTSQVLEAAVKLVVGIAAAVLLKFYFNSIPLAAGGAILGVSVSCLISSFYLNRCYRKAIKDLPITDEDTSSGKEIAKGLLAIAIPITIGSAGLQLLTTLETSVYMDRLLQNVNAMHELKLIEILESYGLYHNGVFPNGDVAYLNAVGYGIGQCHSAGDGAEVSIFQFDKNRASGKVFFPRPAGDFQ
jgi:O-antigen/teichoic acid export membrane protein